MKIAIVQRTALYDDLPGSVRLALDIMRDAKEQGAELVVFGECWLCGYPAWIDHATAYTKWDDPVTKSVFTRMHKNSISLGSDLWNEILTASRDFGICVCMGLNEVDSPSTGTIYNSVVILDHGKLKLHHRKLMPTYTEKLLYGTGDGGGLHAVDTSIGRIGALICWEHWMPLVRQAMHNSSELIHIALWPQVHEMLQIASRHYAFEGRCFVIAVRQVTRASQMPAEVMDESNNTLLLNGGSSVIGPNGKYLLKPQYESPAIIMHELTDLENAISERMTLDVSGHYQRPDLFEFIVKSPN